ncbi:MAG TPA: hypothetical protein VK106_05695 [Balneolaceae bacterium]|nr:hypothetical protein [Balneolaceae bacterium]
MNTNEIFTIGLGLQHPWHLACIKLSKPTKGSQSLEGCQRSPFDKHKTFIAVCFS